MGILGGICMEEQDLHSYVLLDLKEKQSWDLDKKIEYAKEKIIEFGGK